MDSDEWGAHSVGMGASMEGDGGVVRVLDEGTHTCPFTQPCTRARTHDRTSANVLAHVPFKGD